MNKLVLKNYRVFQYAVIVFLILTIPATAQTSNASADGKKISPDLFGLFFEDINYAADGGLYAELVQNRSFEYSPTDKREWSPLSFWEYLTPGYSYGKVHIETNAPVHSNNPHYIVLEAEHVGNYPEHKGSSGVGIRNTGFDGMVIEEGGTYNLSLFARQLSEEKVSMTVSLQTPKGVVLAEEKLATDSNDWKKYTATFRPVAGSDSASLVILITSKGKLALDVVSLFPANTFKKRPNGMRQDLAQLLADIQPRFIRFPGGCLVHGDGLGNMYRWKNTIGPIEERVEQKNLWGYHQSVGLGYYEYFQFCEDIGAKPLPVLPAAVSCQNSGGTWRIGGAGQRALPLDEMAEYIQEVLDLIEWANGPVSSTWGSKRAAAGHPAPFNLQYIGIGNEDKITPEFEERFKLIYEAVKAKYPEITIIGTSGPFSDGEDFERGWHHARHLSVPMVDEHYYKEPQWFIRNQYRYDSYDRKKGKVYLGEYASWGNKMKNAIAEAVYLTTLERNGDVVSMASYAPLLAKKDHTQWKTDMIFFDNTRICLTPNYYVQKMFSTNQGDVYYEKILSYSAPDSTISGSCVWDSKSGDVIIKIANVSEREGNIQVDLSRFKKIATKADQLVLTGKAEDENTFESPQVLIPVKSKISITKKMNLVVSAMSLTVIRIKTQQI